MAAHEGFERFTVAAILEVSGVSRGSLFHYFDSKDELLSQAFVEALLAFERSINAQLSRSTDCAAPFTRAYIHATFDGCVRNRGLWMSYLCFALSYHSFAKRWKTWLSAKLSQYPSEAADLTLCAARQSADGWRNDWVWEQIMNDEGRDANRSKETLLLLTGCHGLN